ncbi:hypothetical protein HPB52_020168 [Rhipicephalus sanguineus]|uniref:Uncharacterized protein n=1 Tax=Rhipicephalus sanguineus TaxID=34632 RepID=A0A9D4SP37_RHISA|nr:hypothetical protein HPB52_020168 [Rhipicephalus sanguineus]
MNRRPFAPPPVSRGKGDEDLYERYGVPLAWTDAEKADNLVFALEDVTKTRCAAASLPTAALELGTAYDCGLPDAFGVTSKVSPRSEGVATIRVNHKRNVMAADATTRECLEQLLNIKELKGIPVTAKEPADYKSSTGFLQGVDGEPTAESLLPGFKSTVPVLAATREGRTLLGCLLHEAIKRACKDLQASHDGAVCQQRQVEAEHKELRFQYGDQEKVLAQHWTNLTNFPVLSADLAVAATPSSLCKEMWADVVRRSASATMTAMTTMVTEADAAHGYPPLPITAGTSTRASTGTVDAEVKRCPVHAPAFVGGVWIHHKVTKTGRAAVPLPTATFELGPASDSASPDA